MISYIKISNFKGVPNSFLIFFLLKKNKLSLPVATSTTYIFNMWWDDSDIVEHEEIWILLCFTLDL